MLIIMRMMKRQSMRTKEYDDLEMKGQTSKKMGGAC